MRHSRVWMTGVTAAALILAARTISAQTPMSGTVRDETGGALPGVSVELRAAYGSSLVAVSDAQGRYRIERVVPGHYQLVFTLVNFGSARRDVDVTPAGAPPIDAVLHLAAKVDVVGPRADYEHANVRGTATVVAAARTSGVGRPLTRSSGTRWKARRQSGQAASAPR